MKIRLATAADAAAIAEIYAPYVTGSTVSFEAEPPGAAEMAARIASGGALYPWLVWEEADGAIAGYASASAFRARHAYRFAVETSVYVTHGSHGRGIGRRLYETLLPLLEAQGFTQAIAAVTLPNEASIALHERLGFTRAGTYERVGYKLGQWLSVGLWQRPLALPGDDPPEPRPFAEVAGP
ncbi:MAG: arsinothricin resistance N-acetyltransferase ArsN1 family B [Sphingosinicella sp.]|uniref:arsinothricin resistance N-acetyltransferase ArsN1 family B n=1 Tax=Sphingosinicella sp. TaxID=1917971 RepID=UPI00403815E5